MNQFDFFIKWVVPSAALLVLLFHFRHIKKRHTHCRCKRRIDVDIYPEEGNLHVAKCHDCGVTWIRRPGEPWKKKQGAIT